jgi:hypothetical protein
MSGEAGLELFALVFELVIIDEVERFAEIIGKELCFPTDEEFEEVDTREGALRLARLTVLRSMEHQAKLLREMIGICELEE